MSDKINKYKITKSCTGCGDCVNISNTHFAINGTGKAVVTVQPKTKQEENLCADAALLCPVSAIVTNNNATDKREVNKSKSNKNQKKIRVNFLNSLRRFIWFKQN